MAINISPAVFGEFSERLKNPYSQFQMNLMLRKKAQQDAMDDYYRKMNESINPEGVRYKDMPGFQKRVEDLKRFSLENREALRRGDIPSQIEYQKRFNNARSYIAGSKDAAQGEKDALGTMEKFRSEDKNLEPIFEILHFNQLPLDDQNFKRFNSTQFLLDHKTFDESAYFDKFSKVPRETQYTLGKVDPKTGYRIDTETKSFSPEIKHGLATQFAQDYHDKWSFNDRVNSLIKDPVERENLAKVFKDNFGDVPKTNEDYAAAYGIRRLQPVITEQGKPVRDEKWAMDYRNAQERRMKEFEHNLKQMDDVQKNTWLKNYIEDQADKAQSGSPKKLYTVGGGIEILGNEIPVTSFISKSFTKDNITPDKLIVSDDPIHYLDDSGKAAVSTSRKLTPIYYKRDDKGNIVKDKEGTPQVIESLSVPQDINSAVIDMGGQVGVKQKNIEGAALMGKKSETIKKTTESSTKSISIPVATKQEWKDAGWTDEQINKASKEGKIKVK